MPYAMREHVCPDCKVRHNRKAPADPPARCVPCRIAFAAEVARQMHAKEGPYYNRWLWRMGSWSRRIAVTERQLTVKQAS